VTTSRPLRLLARIGLEVDVLDDAEVLLEAVLQLAPDYDAPVMTMQPHCYGAYKPAQALAELEKLLAKLPENHLFRTTYANAVVGIGDHERALNLTGSFCPTP